MGIESFYVVVKVENASKLEMENYVKSSPLYEKSLDYCFDETEQELVLIASIASFFNTARIIYKLIKEIINNKNVIWIHSKKEKRIFDFSNGKEFFIWLLELWQIQIDGFEETFGLFAIKPEKFYKKRRKMKSFFVKNN